MKADPTKTHSSVRKIGTHQSLKLLHSFRKNPISMMNDLQKSEGDLVELSLGPKKGVICFHPDLAEQVLKLKSEHYRKSRLVFDKIVPITGRTGLVQLEGEVGREHRKYTGPALTHDAISAALPHLVRSISKGLEKIARAGSHGQETDLSATITEIVLRNAFILILGQEYDTRSLGEAFLEANQICGSRIRNFIPIPSYVPTSGNQRLKKCIGFLDEAIFSSIEKKLKSVNETDKDLLSILVRSNFSKSQIRDHILTFLFAGHETTASSLTWTLYLLSQNPEAEQAIRRECAQNFSSSNSTLSDLRNLPYTLNAYQESLRLFPPSWTLAREAVQETHLGDYRVKKGTLLLLGVGQIQKHSNFWKDAEKFIPERFNGENQNHPYSFIPFGGGSRICIGQRTALIEASLFLAMTVPKFRFHLRPGFKPEVEALITAHPKNGLPVRVEALSGENR